MIGIIGAMDVEIEILLKNMENSEKVTIRGRDFYKGEINKKNVVVARCGVGKVAAASCTQMIIDIFNVDFVINTGVAGGVSKELKVGDIVVSTFAIQHDFNLKSLGYARGYMCTGGDSSNYTKFKADDRLIQAVLKGAKKTLKGNNVHEGVIATGDLFVADVALKQKISAKFGAHATEMEGGAIAQTCVLNEVPFVVIRAISDLADGSDCDNYEKFEREAAESCANLVIACLKNF